MYSLRKLRFNALAMLYTFPLFVISGVLLFSAVEQFVDFTNNLKAFYLTAIPFVIVWLIIDARLSKRLERRWLDKHSNADGSVRS